MKKLLRFLSNYKIQCILSPLFKMLEASFELIVPLVIAKLIDGGIGGNDKWIIIRSVLELAGLALVGLVASITAQYYAARAAVGFSTELRHELFSHLMKLSHSQIDGIGTSTMVTRITSDVNITQNGVNMFLRLFLRSPFVVFGAMVMAFTIDVKAALVFVGTIVALGIVVGVLMFLNIPALKEVQKRLDHVTGSIRENLNGVRVLRAFRLEEVKTASFIEVNGELADKAKSAGHISALMNPLTFILINLGICILIYVGAIRLELGILTQGMVVALYNYMSQILVELVKLANLVVTLNRGLASANRISEIFDMEPGMIYATSEGDVSGKEDDIKEKDLSDSKTAGSTGMIPGKIGNEVTATGDGDSDGAEYICYFDDVSLRYNEGADEALTNITFKVKRGETVGIIGGTGSGKSSIVNLLGRFYDATEGNVYINGKNIKELTEEELHSLVGIVLQKSVLFKGTIRSNLLMGSRREVSDEELISACISSQAKEVVDSKGGLDSEVEQGGRNFSGGQRQRLSIARTLAGRPDILVLDDSASALDYATDLKLRRALAALPYKATVFIISQRTSSISHADQIIVMDDGKMVGLGRHADLLRDCETYREIYESQLRKEDEAAG
ncbi:MAG: ABC transporter ATP-binding protein/permease [Lachnospiraceae bacterium]|nr:ABC transporter ATP-binding protein/permease [Lachnospiraceae bacterium]